MKPVVVVAGLLWLIAAGAPLGRAQTVVPTDQELARAMERLQGERWFGVYMLGRKIGYMHEHLSLTEDRVVHDFEARFEISVFTRKLVTVMKHAATYQRGGDWRLLGAEDSLKDEDRDSRVTARRTEQGIELDHFSGGKHKSLIWKDDLPTALELAPWAAIERMKVGEQVSYHTAEFFDLRLVGQVLELKGRRMTGTATARTRVFEALVRDERGGDVDLLVSEQGIPLEGGMGPSVKIVLETEASAKSLDSTPMDLSKASMVQASGKKISDPTRIEKLRVRILGGGRKVPEDGRQKIVEQDADGFILDLSTTSRGFPGTPEDGDGRWLVCDPKVDCDDPAIRARAAEVAGDRTGLDAVLALAGFVGSYMTYDMGTSLSLATDILSQARGDCLEYSILLTALVRARGIPARVVTGIAFAEPSPLTFGYHAWTEVLVSGNWVPVDSTWKEFPVDATHIKLDVGDGIGMVRHLGAIRLEILDLETASGPGFRSL